MARFKDNSGKWWLVDVDVGFIQRVRSLTGIDLVTVIDGSLLRELQDPVKLADVLYAGCKPEADSRGVTDSEFGRALRGDAIDDASDALMQSLIDFFPRARRVILAAAYQDSRVGTKTIEAALQHLSRYGKSSGATPESCQSTQARSRWGNWLRWLRQDRDPGGSTAAA